ncbi:MAG: RHS repeat domain-containing protein, partial [Planctomycetota bacterium]
MFDADTASTGVLKQNRFVYQNNQLLFKEVTAGGPQTRTYFGYSADRQTVRTIETRDPTVTYSNNTQVLDATRQTINNPTIRINDAIRDLTGNIVEMIDPSGVEVLTTRDALGRSTIQSRSKNSLTLTTQSQYNADGNVTQSTAVDGIVTSMTYDDAGNLKERTVGFGTPLAMTTSYGYGPDSMPVSVISPDGGVATTDYQTCCGFTVGSRNALGHGTITNQNSNGQTVHSATIADYDSHSNLLDPIDAKTLSETTTAYRPNGRVQYRTVWKSPLGAITRDNPPIAGVGGVAAADGVTTQYVYDTKIFDEQDLDDPAGLTIDRLGGGTAQITIVPALTKLAESNANGGANTDLSG